MKKWNTFIVFALLALWSAMTFAESAESAKSAESLASFFDVQSVGQTLTFTPSSQLPRSYLYTGMKFTSTYSGFGLPNSGTECSTIATNGYCLYSSTPNVAKTLTMSGPKGAFEMSLCLNGQGNTASCDKYTISGNRFVYVVNAPDSPTTTNQIVQICQVNALTGAIITPCTNTEIANSGVAENLRDLALNPSGSRAYITNNINSRNVLLCNINSTTGVFTNSDCSVASSAQGVIGGAYGIAINPQGTFAYIIGQGGANIVRCAVSPTDGTLSPCMSILNIYTSFRLAINPAGTFLYVGVNGAPSQVMQCAISQTDGSLSTCRNAGATTNDQTTLGTPLGVALNAAGTLFYETRNDGAIIMCSINASTGLLSNCQVTGPTLTTLPPQGLVINNGDIMAYVANTTVRACPMSPSTGTITATAIANCTDTNITVEGNITLR